MRQIFIAPILFYQKWISPAFPARCKYYPSCSSYAATAISSYGLRGVAMSIWRLARCNPWSHGGVDYAVISSKKTLKNQPKTTLITSAGAH
jgi:putative membrane protein insertion efficiency factor